MATYPNIAPALTNVVYCCIRANVWSMIIYKYICYVPHHSLVISQLVVETLTVCWFCIPCVQRFPWRARPGEERPLELWYLHSSYGSLLDATTQLELLNPSNHTWHMNPHEPGFTLPIPNPNRATYQCFDTYDTHDIYHLPMWTPQVISWFLTPTKLFDRSIIS